MRSKTLSFLLFFLLLAGGVPFPRAMADEGEDKLPFAPPSSPSELPEAMLIETEKGSFEVLFYREQAPISIRAFEFLGRKGFYDNLTFHRYIEKFVIQGGDPLGNGKGGPGFTLPPEVSELKHVRGTVGMARKPGEVNPERRSNGSQFYICLTEAPHLDGLYTVIGRVVQGMEVVDELRAGDKIVRVRFAKK